MSMMSRYRCLALLLVLQAAVFTQPAAPAVAAEGNPLLRIVHASPDAPAIEVYLDGQRVLAALTFAAASPYVTVPAGMHRLRATAAGTASGDKGLIDTMIDLQSGQAYTVVAADTAAKMVSVVVPDRMALPDADKTAVRLFHASPDAPSVADVAVAGGGPVVFKNLAFKAGTDYAEVAPGAYRFEVRPAGTTQAIATTPQIDLVGGKTYTIFAMGLLSDSSFQAVVVPDQAASGGVGGTPSAGIGGRAEGQTNAARILTAALGALLLLSATRRRQGER